MAQMGSGVKSDFTDHVLQWKNGVIVLNPALLQLDAFKKLRASCGGNGVAHKKATQIMNEKVAYLYFMEHYNSKFVENFPYEEDLRKKEVIRKLGDISWKKEVIPEDSEIIAEAREEFRFHIHTLYVEMLNSARVAAIDMIESFRRVKHNAGQRGYSPHDIIDSIKKLKDSLIDIRELWDGLKSGDFETINIRGGGTVGEREQRPEKRVIRGNANV